ncbi:MAG: hypothetical protein PHP62_05405 [Candidatus Moranbacteria bacterium]|nr:hypothetical protein [Candidatus Moranbacteria bacterium]
MAKNTIDLLRQLTIHGMTRQRLIGFIKRRDGYYSRISFAGQSDEQLRILALGIEKVKGNKKKSQLAI